jgi:ATP-dependent Clp protease ATP-binding subunit ClpB
VDDIIVFRPLDREDLRRIVDLQLERVRRLATELGVALEVEEEVKVVLAEEGYDPIFGARPLKRVIQQRIQNPLAMRLLEEEVGEGARVRVRRPEGAASEAPFELEVLVGAPVG